MSQRLEEVRRKTGVFSGAQLAETAQRGGGGSGRVWAQDGDGPPL